MKNNLKSIKKRRRLIAGIILLLFLIIFFWLLFQKRDFIVTYEKDGFQITEEYQKKENIYLFTIQKEEKEYQTILTEPHFYNKKIIQNIIEFQENEETCITLTSKKAKFFPLCLNENNAISYHLISEEMKSHLSFETLEPKEQTYQQMNIMNTLNHEFFIWNYRGFYEISDKSQKELPLFEKDIYDAKLITKTSDYILIPNYNQEYYFSSVYLLNRKTLKYEEWNLKQNIYFDSQVLGIYNDEIYLVDKHEKKEYVLNPKKKTINKVGNNDYGKVYENGWQEVSMTKLTTQEYSFQGLYPIDYQIEDALYEVFNNYKRKITQNKPTKIIQKNESEIFYLEGDTLYSYTDRLGNIKLISYFEWNFNNQNTIFIF